MRGSFRKLLAMSGTSTPNEPQSRVEDMVSPLPAAAAGTPQIQERGQRTEA